MAAAQARTGEAVVLLGRGMPRNEQADTLDRVREALAARWPDRDIRIAFLEMTPPGLREVLTGLRDEGLRRAIVVPLFVPYDRNIKAWLPRAVSQWLNIGDGGALDVVFASPALEVEDLLGLSIRAVETAHTLPSASSLRPLRKRPGSSDIPKHQRHVLVCVGPRCVEAGAWETYDRLRSGLRERGLADAGPDRVLLTRTACQHPCNMAPLITVYPDGIWYGGVDADTGERIVDNHLIGGTVLADLARRAGDMLEEDPMNKGDVDDMTASAQAGDIKIKGAFARRAMHLEDAGAIFMTITNSGSEGDTLLSAKVYGASRVWVHGGDHDDSHSGLPLHIAPGASVTLAPGGLHMMLESLMTQVSEGQDVDATLVFERAGALTLRVPVNHPPAAMGGA